MLDMNKDTIEGILEHGGSVHLPYKEKLSDWFQTHGVSFARLGSKYSICGGNIYGALEFDTFEEAWEKFEEYTNNVGAIQEYVRMRNPHIESYGDINWDEMKRLVKNEKARRKRVSKC